ncbi:phage integrase,Integrase,site-specific tyrosine recombinase XerC,Site-specific recombinase XerD,tyrosine recombinase XerD,Phage integrase family [[Clostridium] sordellii]|uniref:tyrosine-type recombinase/integrase n=1 Tax=Paraclostridium sordellii TaxID=1505 RepID=UPI000542F556|nr:tyrosine-type recombinase/integrase [Paeniclostridium sordellii]CEK34611.1 phage integrase,Integrase,site-specific tyrosine recombinase XerC,Site-specific recombinase XerD,tyrosine recombinase XerD,Phage integrase family [[Clostridium] sordellii] [Paeniclostridium sordellii]
MANKRANGEGSIGKYKDGWRSRIMIGYDENGKPIRKEFYGKTQKEAKEKLENFKKQYLMKNIEIDNTTTLEQWFYTYMFEYKKNKIKPSSFERYEGIYRNYILGTNLGKTKLFKLNVTIIQKYYNTLLNNNVPPATIKAINQHLKPCLGEAEKQDYIQKNYAKLIELPKIKKEDTVEILTIEHQKQFLKAIEGHKLQVLFLIALGTGLRLGEILGLKWGDIDFDNCNLSVNRSLKRVCFIDENLNKEYKVIEQEPKTINSYRTVPIPSDVLVKLKEHKINQNKEILKAGSLYNNHNYVFCNELGYPLDSKRPTRNLQSILKKLGIKPIKFHGLRHTYATRLFEANVPPKTVQMLMGHSDITITLNIYTKVMDEVKVEAVDKINNIFAL